MTHISQQINELKKLPCISAMDTTHLEKWEALSCAYVEKLNTCIRRETAFTPHDFDHHCRNLYELASDIVLRHSALTNEAKYQNELFMLNISILLHDISMSQPEFDRYSHAEDSATYILEKRNEHPLVKLSAEETKWLCNNIRAHSDPKDKYGDRLYYAISKLPSRTAKDKQKNIVAGLLRFVDELDVSSRRFDRSVYNDFQHAIEKLESQNLHSETADTKIRDMKASFWHWKKCILIQSINRSEIDKNRIDLVLDDDEMLSCGDLENHIQIVWEVKEKIEESLKDLRDSCFNKSDFYSEFAYSYDKIDIVSENPLINDLLTHYLRNDLHHEQPLRTDGVSTPIPSSENETHSGISCSSSKYKSTRPTKTNTKTCTDQGSESLPQNQHIDLYNTPSIKLALNDEIKKYVLENNLLSFGHFTLNETYCARDWIELSSFFESIEWMKKFSTTIAEHIQESVTSDILKSVAFVGLDFFGMLFASSVAMKLNSTFSFMVPIIREEAYTPKDLSVELPPFCNKVILFCDVIATTKTINDVCNSLQNYISPKNKVKHSYDTLSIYTLFLRKPNINVGNLPKNVYSLNNSFPVEITKKNLCPYRNIYCYAKNKPQNYTN